jgi:DNA helicase-2/ATP-dependent DNA helicase PcrA
MDFPKTFSGCVVIKLEENYRSTQSILDVANAVLENISNKYSKSLVSAKKTEGARPHLLYFKDVYEEAGWIADKIKDMRDDGTPFGHQAVLFRSAYVSIPLQAELSRRGIPYQVFGGLKFYETAHVKDLISHLKVAVNPGDEISWNRVLMLIEGIGPKTAEKITEGIIACLSLDDAVEKVLASPQKQAAYSPRLKKLGSSLSAVASGKAGVGERYERILEYYLPLMRDKFDDWHIRVNDLEALRQIVATYKSLEDLLADFSIEAPERGVMRVDAEVPADERPLTLSTIHSAKGLEWEAVFVTGVADGLLPISFALNSEDDLEEEHRLFYVALTRAKAHLYLSLHHEGTKGGITQFNKISRFVDQPNVLAMLEQKAITDPEFDEDSPFEDDDTDTIRRHYDKDSLLRDIIDTFN